MSKAWAQASTHEAALGEGAAVMPTIISCGTNDAPEHSELLISVGVGISKRLPRESVDAEYGEHLQIVVSVRSA